MTQLQKTNGTTEAPNGEETIESLRRTVAEQSRRLARLEATLTKPSGDGASPPRPIGGATRVSRSGLLKTAVAGTAAAIGVVALGGGGATALGATKDTNFTAYGTDTTYTPDSSIGFDASDKAAGFDTGVSGFGKRLGVVGETASETGYGVGALNSSKHKKAIALLAETENGYTIASVSSTGVGVYGVSISGNGIRGDSTSGAAMVATTKAKALPALSAKNASSGSGVLGESASGRGGQFQGGAAAVQILASKHKSHPRSGRLGDIMLDAQHRLWFCKRGGSPAKWVQLA